TYRPVRGLPCGADVPAGSAGTVPGRAGIRGSLGCPLLAAVSASRPALPHHISGVVGGGPDKKVVRLDALPVIACMTHQPVGHLSISQEPRDAMSAVVLAETTESAIPVMSKRTCPFPAIAGRINLLPEQGYSVIIGVH